MRSKLFVHIGTPKTGSSSLQRALHDGAYSTDSVRIAYPSRLSEADLALALVRGREKEVARRLRSLGGWLGSVDADAFVLSSEHLVGVPAQTFASAMRRHLPEWPARTHVVCYLRPHGSRLVSAFAQQRKSGQFLGSMDAYLRVVERDSRFQYADRLAAWNDVYPGRFVARQMSTSALVGGDVVADFLHLVTSGATVTVHAERLNPSPTVEVLALLGIVHRELRARGVPDGIARRIGKRIAVDLGTAGVADRGHRLTLSASEAAAVAAIFAEDAARLDATFFSDSRAFTEDLRRLTEQAPDATRDLDPRSYADRDARRAIRQAAATLAGVAVDHGRPWVAQFRAAKGYRHDSAALHPDSVARVEAALEPVVSRLAAALRTLP